MLLNLNTHEADLNAGLLRLGPSIEAFGDNTCHYIRTNPGKKNACIPYCQTTALTTNSQNVNVHTMSTH